MEEIIMSLENGVMERWRKGDPWGFTDICAEEVTYKEYLRNGFSILKTHLN